VKRKTALILLLMISSRRMLTKMVFTFYQRERRVFINFIISINGKYNFFSDLLQKNNIVNNKNLTLLNYQAMRIEAASSQVKCRGGRK
jgi:hypothetical protein